MDQILALEILLSGKNALLTGPAGSGKTYVLNEFIRHAKHAGTHVSVTATTGLAATHLGGSTIHSWSGIGIQDHVSSNFYDNLSKSRRDIIQKTDILVIDEISMLHAFQLDMVDEVARTVREKDEPFGGIQVVLCGDFFQLPPVSKNDQPAGLFVVESNAWQDFHPVICYLNEQHRQSDDAFVDILNAMRSGDVRRRHAEQLLHRQNAEVEGEITELHTTNADVEVINQTHLKSMDSDEYTYTLQSTGKEGYVESLKRSCLAVETLVLKKGALVICIKNNPEKRYVNGSLGVVESFEEETEYPIVRLRDGRRVTIGPDSWELRDGDKKRAGISQIPLRLAWAITIHKSQGMTLDAARIDLRRAFVEGMGYVALSRVRSLDTLSLVGINAMALKVSPVALEIDENLRKQSVADAQTYEHLRKNHKKRKEIPAKKAESDWTNKLQKMRDKYPNAYRPWTQADDEKLMSMFEESKSVDIDELTKSFGRHPGSIRARLKKHFGEDAIA